MDSKVARQCHGAVQPVCDGLFDIVWWSHDVRLHQESARHAKLPLRRRLGWSSVLRFAILAKVMLAFVIIPISNAASERALSMVRKIETDFRLLLSEEVDYECEYKLSQLFSDKHVQR